MTTSAHKTDLSKHLENECFYPMVFTGKEKDSETGLYNFGARYYDSDLSGLFLSVDPMADKYPSLSPYAYCAWNPVRLVDPNGKDTINIYLDKGTIELNKADGDHSIRYLKNGELAGSEQIKKDKCSFRTRTYDIEYTDGKNESKCHNEHLLCSNSEIGEIIFKKLANLGSSVEWDYYSMKQDYGDLSSSGLKDKMIHYADQYTANTVNYWDHYHPTNNSDSFFPSYSDQDQARSLNGVRCTIFSDGRSMDFNNLVPSNNNGYINVPEFRQLWNRFAK